MARMLLPEEEIAVEYRAVKPSKADLKSKRRLKAVLVSVAIALILISTVVIVVLRLRDTPDNRMVPSNSNNNNYPETVVPSRAGVAVSTRGGLPLERMFIPTAIPSAVTSTELEELSPATEDDQPRRVEDNDTKWSDKSNLEKWTAFLDESEPVTEEPLALSNTNSLIYQVTPWILYIEKHDGIDCFVVASFPDSFMPKSPPATEERDPSTYASLNFTEYGQYYRRRRHNLTASADLYREGLQHLEQQCQNVPIVPVRQVQALPTGHYFTMYQKY